MHGCCITAGAPLTGFGVRRQKLGGALPGLVLPLALWRLVWRFQFVPASLGRIHSQCRVLSAVATLLFAVVLLKVFLTPGLPPAVTRCCRRGRCFLLCTCIELHNKRCFEAFIGMVTMPDLLTDRPGHGCICGLCGLATSHLGPPPGKSRIKAAPHNSRLKA